MTKTEQVLNHLTNNVGITGTQAYELFGLMRLSAVIFNLKKKGYDILTISHYGTDQNGNPSKWAEYRMIKDA